MNSEAKIPTAEDVTKMQEQVRTTIEGLAKAKEQFAKILDESISALALEVSRVGKGPKGDRAVDLKAVMPLLNDLSTVLCVKEHFGSEPAARVIAGGGPKAAAPWMMPNQVMLAEPGEWVLDAGGYRPDQFGGIHISIIPGKEQWVWRPKAAN